VIVLRKGKLFESTLSILHPDVHALNAFKSFIDKNKVSYFTENSDFDEDYFNSLKEKY